MIKKFSDQLKKLKGKLSFKRDRESEISAEEGPRPSIQDKLKDWGHSLQNLWGGLGGLARQRTPSPVHRKKAKIFPHWNPEKFTHAIFAVESRGNIHKGFLVALTIGLTYTLGKALALLLSGPELPSKGKPLNLTVQDPEEIASRLVIVKNKNLFKALTPDSPEGSKAKPVIDKNIICKESDLNSSLPISLINTIVLQDSVKSLASVQIRGAPDLKNLREGDKIEEFAEIGKILRLSIIIKNLQTGACEKVSNAVLEKVRSGSMNVLNPSEGRKLMQSHKMTGITQEGNQISIAKSVLNEKLADMENVLTQARAIQVQNPDGSLAFKIVEITPGSVFSFLGIQDGDNITQINGKKIMGLNDVMNLLGNIQNVDNLQLTIVKDDGSEQNMEYDFK